jgi:hypothetical protein
MGKKSSSEFKDTRLDKTFLELLSEMVNRYSVILRQLSDDKNTEVRFQNFIKNKKVTPNRILSHHCSLLKNDWSEEHMLVISDTSTLSFPYRADREELGEIGGVKSKHSKQTKFSGFNIHPSIFVNSSNGGLCGLGAVDIIKTPISKSLVDQVERLERRRLSPKLAFEEKERYKWFNSPSKAIENTPRAKKYTFIGDRETDIYDLMHRTLEQGHDFIYRSQFNRRIFPLTKKENLSDVLKEWKVEFSYPLMVETTKNRSKHEAELEVKYGSTLIAKPKNHPDETLPSHLPIQVIEVKEASSTVFPNERPIHWILLTTHPVQTRKQVMQIIQWYLYRWIIEELFRTLKKKGLNIEVSEVETYHGLTNLTTLALLAAVQTMQLVQARKGKTNQKLDDVFLEKEQQCLILLNEKLQGKTEKTQNPYDFDTLAFGAWVIARLGGWNGYETERPPGPITMTNGLIRFYQMLQGFYLIL